MSVEKAVKTPRAIKMPVIPNTSHKSKRVHGSTLALSSSIYEPRPPLGTAKLFPFSPASISTRKRVPKIVNSTVLNAKGVPVLQLKNLSFNGSNMITPLSSSRTIETITSSRTKRGSQFVFAVAPPLNLSGHVKLNESLGGVPRPLTRSLSKKDIEPRGSDTQPEVVYPITAAQATRLFHEKLTDFEQGEILEFQQIYFLGLNSAKVKGNSPQTNFGYDDERGDYVVVIGDHFLYQYEVLSILGKGSFGQVVKCFDHKAKEVVALKVIRNKRRFHLQGMVEVKVLDHLRTHDVEDRMCIVKMKNHFVFRKHLCLTFELLSINLYEFLKNNDFSGLSLNLVRRFGIQLLIALRYSKSHGIIHCDLKPENILLKQPNKSGIKVIDFGSSCFETERIYTYIQSRFYRAPEIILGIAYTTCIDMWSLGCILVELYTGYPLFPGESEQEQLLCIMEVLGLPPDSVLDQSSRKKLFFDVGNVPRIVANSRGKKRYPNTKSLETVVQSSDMLFLDFVSKCLTWSPEARLTPEQAIKHQWVLEGISKMQQEQNKQSGETKKSSHKH